MDNYNIKKLEEEAFNTIDDIFSDDEDDNDDSLYDHVEKDREIERLEEKMLSLDWEFSPEDLSDVRNIIGRLKQKYSDNISKILLTMMDNISKFIMDTREKAPADSLSLLAQVLDTFKKVTDDRIDESVKREKLKKIYGIFSLFKQNLAERAKHTKTGSGEKLEDTRSVRVGDGKILSEEKALPDDRALSVKKVSSSDSDKPISESDIPSEYGSEINLRLIRIERKIDFIISVLGEKTDSSLFEGEPEISSSVEYADSEDSMEKLSGSHDYLQSNSQFDFDQNNPAVEQDKSATMDYEQFDMEKDQIIDKEKDEPDFLNFETDESRQSYDSDSDQVESVSSSDSEGETDNIPYVLIFYLGDKLLAFPYEFVSNIYPVSTTKAKKFLKTDEIPLQKLKGFMKPLKKNMRGNLKTKSERELQKLVVTPKSLSMADENTAYSNAVLVDCGETYRLIFVGKQKSSLVYLPDNFNPVKDENDIMAEVEIEDGEKALLINPCS